MNLKLTYLYRDAGNYKYWAEVIFGNRSAMSPDRAHAALRALFLMDELFVADQIRLKELFPYHEHPTEDDHCFHELFSVENTEADVTDALDRDFLDLLKESERASHQGWRGFSVSSIGRVYFVF